jgi:phospholipase C
MTKMLALGSALCGLALLAGCSNIGRDSSPVSAVVPNASQSARVRHLSSSGKIQHVVIIVQEDRSFDNLFQGYPGADTVSSGKDSHGNTIVLQPVSLATQYVLDHSSTAMFAACNGPQSDLPGTHCAMDGFNNEESYGGPPNPAYVYVPRRESKPYFDMAHEGVLADRMFPSNLDESFVSHQYIIAAQARRSVDNQSAFEPCDGPTDEIETLTDTRTVGPMEQACFNYQTLGDEIDNAGLTWRYYTSTPDGDGGEWSAYQAVKHIRYGPDWAKDVITPQTQFLTDVQAGTLSNVTWITPTCENSDHVNCGARTGPKWVSALVNAVGESQFWNSTAIFIMWSEWGGLYDHVAPPFVGYDGLGIRVPLVILSAYSKQNFVSHVQYEHGSILRFAEDQFGLGQLAASDKRANSPEKDCFDFSKPPHAFVPITVKDVKPAI